MKNKILSSIILILVLLSSTLVYATDEQVEIPTAYDLRSDISIKVENQGTNPWCTFYSYTKMVETYLQKTKGLNYNLSETFLLYRYAFQGEYGNFALESDFPNKEYEITEINQKKFDEATTKAIGKFKETSNVVKTKDDIKKYIMNYGAVWTIVFEGDKQASTEWYNTNGSINCKNNYKPEYNGTYNHAAIIIGWDDNYSKNNFKSSSKPENDGAWLVLNSWGSNWGNKGTVWVSYEDNYMQNGTKYGIEYITLANGEVIETKLADEKEETTETPVIEQQNQTQKMIEEHNNIKNMQNIFIIAVAVIIILLITLIIIKHNNQSNLKDNNSKKKSKLKIVIIIELILIVLAMIFML